MNEELQKAIAGRKVISLDYDGTASTNIGFWIAFTEMANKNGYAVIMVTMRSESEAADIDYELRCACVAVVCTNRQAKMDCCAHLGLTVDIWIDDMPAAILSHARVAYGHVE